MNVFNGKRMVIYEKQGRFEAPNWMPDGKQLLFNMDGLLYKIPVTGGELVKLNTGFANRNNNDHGISFNGKLLAISRQKEGYAGRRINCLCSAPERRHSETDYRRDSIILARMGSEQ